MACRRPDRHDGIRVHRIIFRDVVARRPFFSRLPEPSLSGEGDEPAVGSRVLPGRHDVSAGSSSTRGFLLQLRCEGVRKGPAALPVPLTSLTRRAAHRL